METQSLSQTGEGDAIQVRDESAQSRRTDRVSRQLGLGGEHTLVQSLLAVTVGLCWEHQNRHSPGAHEWPKVYIRILDVVPRKWEASARN